MPTHWYSYWVFTQVDLGQSAWSQEPYNVAPYGNHHTEKKALNRYSIFLLDQRCWEYFWIGNTDGQKFWWNSRKCSCSISQLHWHHVVPKSFHFYLPHHKLCRVMYTTAGASSTVGRLFTSHFQLTTPQILTFNFLSIALTNIP